MSGPSRRGELPSISTVLEPAWVRIALLGVALAFLALFLFVPLVAVFVEAFKKGPRQICTVFGPTCDALDVISMAEDLPANLERGDLLLSRNIRAYSVASSTWFNGFPPAKIVHVNR